MRSLGRRKFLKTAVTLTGAVGSSWLSPGSSVGLNSKVMGANDRIRVALIGCGGMGRGDLRDFLRIKNVRCVALCDVDDAQSSKAAADVEGQGFERPNLVTRDFRRILEEKDLDAVIVATPDHWHALPTVLACQAGKDVYVEKPLSTSIGEGRIMVDTARRHNRVVQMGTQQRSATHYGEAVEYVRSGKLGKIRLVRAWAYLDWKGEVPVTPDSAPPSTVDYDFWLGPAPKRPFNKNRFHVDFRWYWDYSGGLMTDWGAHMIDVANWAMGAKAPGSAVSVGGKLGYPQDAMETPDTQQVLWSFPDFTMIWEHALGIGRGPETREHGVAFHGNNGVLVVDRGGWEVYPETDQVDKPVRLFRGTGVPRQNAGRDDYHLLHVQNFVECMSSRKRPNSDVEIGHNSMIACHIGNIAQRLGRFVKWDAARETIVNEPEASAFVSRTYRSPWKLSS
jgi:predicted dehydrogenase